MKIKILHKIIQNLSIFKLPINFRGRSVLFVQLWWIVQIIFFQCSPQVAYGFRRWLLRCFGATIGKEVIIRPSVTITYPWKVKIGEFTWIGDNVVMYSLGEIEIGSHAVISQHSYLCASDHDYTQEDFPIRARKITIGEQAWVAADVFIAPGVSIGAGAVVGARSSVFSDMPAWMVCYGYPCKPVKKRHSQHLTGC